MVTFFLGTFFISVERNEQAVVYILGGKNISSEIASFQAGVSTYKKAELHLIAIPQYNFFVAT